MEMDRTIVKREDAGALVAQSGKKDKAAVALGTAGIAISFLPFLGAYHFLGLAAGIAAMVVSWDSVTSKDRRTTLATAAFVMGAVPVAFEAVSLLGFALKLLIVGAIVGGIYYGARTVQRKKAGPELQEPAESV